MSWALRKDMVITETSDEDCINEVLTTPKAMFFHTDTADSPWTIIKSDDKKRARLNCMQHFLGKLDYPGKDEKIVMGSDPLIVGSPKLILRADVHLDKWPNS
jgi:hypothetical protein